MSTPAPLGTLDPVPKSPRPLKLDVGVGVPSDPLPLYIGTGVFAVLFIILPCCVRRGPNKGITQCCILLTVFSVWLFWAVVYIAQMRPLMGPQMANTSLAWMKQSWNQKPA